MVLGKNGCMTPKEIAIHRLKTTELGAPRVILCVNSTTVTSPSILGSAEHQIQGPLNARQELHY